MKNFKFLVQTLLIAIPLAFVSCSSDDDDFKIPTPQNSDILLENFKFGEPNSDNYFGAKFEYDDDGQLIEAYDYYYNASSADTSYNKKYIFNKKQGDIKIIDIYYPDNSTNPSVWTKSMSPKNLRYQNNHIVEIENYMGSSNVILTWEKDRIVKSVIPDWSTSAQDSIIYYKGNYADYKPQTNEWSGRKDYYETKTIFSTYANYYQMIPIEYIAAAEGHHLQRYFPLNKYFSDNAISSIQSTSKNDYFSDNENMDPTTSSEYINTKSYTLTFGSLSKRVPEKISVSNEEKSKYTDHKNSDNNRESATTTTEVISFTYTKKK